MFNGVWQLLDKADRSTAEDDRMLHMAHASRFHWENVGTAVNLARGEWLCLARAHAVAGDSCAARAATEQALAAVEDIAEEDDRSLALADLETIPGQPRFW